MAKLLEVERARQEALARAEAERRKRDRQILTYLLAAGVVFIVIVILLSLRSLLGG